MLRQRVILAAVLLAVGLGGSSCGASQAVSASPLEGAARLCDGGTADFGELRGRPVVLILFATSDSASELQIPEAQEAFASIGGLVYVMALSMDPNDEPMLQAYSEFNKAKFPMGMAPESIRNGKSALGKIDLVPAVIFLDKDGRVRAKRYGVTTAEIIEKTARKILGPIDPPPVLNQ